jgi:hypothetical protein
MSCRKKENIRGSRVRFGGEPNRDLASRHDRHANRERSLLRVALTQFEWFSRNPTPFAALKLS